MSKEGRKAVYDKATISENLAFKCGENKDDDLERRSNHQSKNNSIKSINQHNSSIKEEYNKSNSVIYDDKNDGNNICSDSKDKILNEFLNKNDIFTEKDKNCSKRGQKAKSYSAVKYQNNINPLNNKMCNAFNQSQGSNKNNITIYNMIQNISRSMNIINKNHVDVKEFADLKCSLDVETLEKSNINDNLLRSTEDNQENPLKLSSTSQGNEYSTCIQLENGKHFEPNMLPKSRQKKINLEFQISNNENFLLDSSILSTQKSPLNNNNNSISINRSNLTVNQNSHPELKDNKPIKKHICFEIKDLNKDFILNTYSHEKETKKSKSIQKTLFYDSLNNRNVNINTKFILSNKEEIYKMPNSDVIDKGKVDLTEYFFIILKKYCVNYFFEIKSNKSIECIKIDNKNISRKLIISKNNDDDNQPRFNQEVENSNFKNKNLKYKNSSPQNKNIITEKDTNIDINDLKSNLFKIDRVPIKSKKQPREKLKSEIVFEKKKSFEEIIEKIEMTKIINIDVNISNLLQKQIELPSRNNCLISEKIRNSKVLISNPEINMNTIKVKGENEFQEKLKKAFNLKDFEKRLYLTTDSNLNVKSSPDCDLIKEIDTNYSRNQNFDENLNLIMPNNFENRKIKGNFLIL